jgi:hypothetical protein
MVTIRIEEKEFLLNRYILASTLLYFGSGTDYRKEELLLLGGDDEEMNIERIRQSVKPHTTTPTQRK